MAGQQICLKWNSFQSNIVTSFESLWEEQGLVDVTLASDGQCLRAHKVILSACSPFFRKVFQTNPCQHPVIILQDVHFSELESLLSFMYKGEVNIEQENLPALLRAAETLQIRGLSGASEQVKEKMGVCKKSPSPQEPIPVDGQSPPKKQRTVQQSQSPPLPSTPLALTPTSRTTTERLRRQSASSAEAWEQHQQTNEPECPPKVIPKLESRDSESESLASPLLSIDEPHEESTDGSLGGLQDLKSSQSKAVASDTGQIKGEAGSDLVLPYQKLPYACLLPRAQVLATWAKARTLEQLACDLMKILFTTEERILCNVNGKMGKRQFNIHKIQLIREVLHFFSSLPAAEFEEQWKSCVTKIDTANRGLKRNLVLRGRKATCFL
ncbi:protein bric-a-brac 1-like isoform X3 [Schistocerca gregaria]|uniref:protein bric-a-brac 1-like isoform X3 n=1 Tax=Schistocerca gregaria TaxID=7010 RepID=UPI00211DD25A|nr:protein bric-a-brac 1-like isoform X3 [Schistocerca gregaria]